MNEELGRYTREEAHQTWWQTRLDDLARQIEAGEYFVPADEIAAAILFGRPKWGDNPDSVGLQPSLFPEDALR